MEPIQPTQTFFAYFAATGSSPRAATSPSDNTDAMEFDSPHSLPAPSPVVMRTPAWLRTLKQISPATTTTTTTTTTSTPILTDIVTASAVSAMQTDGRHVEAASLQHVAPQDNAFYAMFFTPRFAPRDDWNDEDDADDFDDFYDGPLRQPMFG
eukprot:TRINITY_DN1688_c0_g1_i2.p1 TRINITY_DN1688_c0_g1~~TRINITY_DN1688_c0_g1_i2.p1  ORF type:complete len:153 (+),score=37.19 TRINITY_DN1688_c0_g1_i2:492-950(+)